LKPGPQAGLLKTVEQDWDAPTVEWEAPTVTTAPSALELMDRFDKCVVGHSQAKEALIGALRLHLLRQDGNGHAPRVMLMGPRGVGKTTLAEALFDCTQLPAIRVDFGDACTHGEVDIPRLLSALIPRNGDTSAVTGIFFLDGIEHLTRTMVDGAPTFDGRLVQVELLRAMDGLDVRTADGRWISCEDLLICGAVTIEEPLKNTSPQSELRQILDAACPLIPEFASRFDLLVPVDRLSAAQMAKSFALSRSPFARARRVISSLGGSFHCDPRSVEALARTCAISPVGGWAANRVIDRLLEQVLRAPDPAKAWKLRDPQP
jgi:ATP-dependent Clp protease ATP-binding subunit ClpA